MKSYESLNHTKMFGEKQPTRDRQAPRSSHACALHHLILLSNVQDSPKRLRPDRLTVLAA
jgi:hypothetical protein